MARKEFVQLMENNILLLDKLAYKLKKEPTQSPTLPRQQLNILVRLYVSGRTRLKDIARCEQITTPNLCAAFRKLERDGFVSRTVDETDRRNTWYECTAPGADLAAAALEKFRGGIEKMFSDLSQKDEARFTNALREIEKILTNMELENA